MRQFETALPFTTFMFRNHYIRILQQQSSHCCLHQIRHTAVGRPHCDLGNVHASLELDFHQECSVGDRLAREKHRQLTSLPGDFSLGDKIDIMSFQFALDHVHISRWHLCISSNENSTHENMIQTNNYSPLTTTEASCDSSMPFHPATKAFNSMGEPAPNNSSNATGKEK